MSKVDPFLTLSFPVELLNSPNLSPCSSLNKFERISLLIFSSLLCLINSHFLITKCLIFFFLCKEKLTVDKWLGVKGLSHAKLTVPSLHAHTTLIVLFHSCLGSLSCLRFWQNYKIIYVRPHSIFGMAPLHFCFLRWPPF